MNTSPHISSIVPSRTWGPLGGRLSKCSVRFMALLMVLVLALPGEGFGQTRKIKEKKVRLKPALVDSVQTRIDEVTVFVPRLDMAVEDPRWEIRSWTNVVISRLTDRVLNEEEAHHYLRVSGEFVRQMRKEEKEE